jgi:Protein of unknown function (DUF2857)
MLIRDEHIRFLVFSHLIEGAVHDRAFAEECGANPADLDALANLPSTDLVRLAALPEPRLSVWMDGKQLAHGFRLLSHLKNNSQMIAYFVKNGATTAMLMSLFRITAAEVAAQRATWGITAERKKPSLPPVKVREEIQTTWHHIVKNRTASKTGPNDYYALHQAFPGYTFASLNASLHEFD